LVAAGSGRTETGASPAPPPAAPARTYGAPPGLLPAARHIEDLFKQKAYTEAVAYCQKGHESAKDDETRAFYLRYTGETYLAAQSERCLDYFRQVVDRFPQTEQVSWAKFDIASTYYYKAKYFGNVKQNAAIFMPMLQQLLKDYPKHEMAAGGLYVLGWGHENLSNEKAALAQYQKAVDLYPNYPWADLSSKRVYELHQKSGRWDDAIAAARRYIELFPYRGPAEAQMAIGRCYRAKGDLPSALPEFEKVMSQYPGSSEQCIEALFQKGQCQRILGQTAAARSTFEALIKSYPNDYRVPLAKQQLRMIGAQ
jgi:TolA-binding protein